MLHHAFNHWVAETLGIHHDALNRPARREGCGDKFGPFNSKPLLFSPSTARREEASKLLNRRTLWSELLAQEADSRASTATLTSAEKAAGSVTARSARILRSTSAPAAWRPAIKRL